MRYLYHGNASVMSLINELKQIRVQPPTAAVNVTLLAFAADRRAAVNMDRKAAAPAAECRRAVQQSIDISCPQQQTRRTLLQRADWTDRHRTIT